MKKYIILSLVSLSIILTIFASGYTKISSIEYVSAFIAERTTAFEKLNYSGTVEYNNSTAALSSGSGMVQSVFVNSGDYVEKGTPILSVYQTDAEISKSDILSAITSNDFDSVSSFLDSNASIEIYEAQDSGILSDLDLEEGSIFQKNQTLFKISPQRSFQIRVNVIEKDIPKIKTDQSVRIDCKAVPKVLIGTVKSIGNSAKQTTTANGKETTVTVIIGIDEECEEIKSGYTAECSITVSEKENTVLIPYHALGTDDNGKSFVYVIKDNRLQKKYVDCGFEYTNGIEIKKGISENDIVASDASQIKDPENTVVNEVKLNGK